MKGCDEDLSGSDLQSGRKGKGKGLPVFHCSQTAAHFAFAERRDHVVATAQQLVEDVVEGTFFEAVAEESSLVQVGP